MLQQYLEYKAEYPDCLILIQVGDFYEAFFDDAIVISERLNLTLTSRDKNAENPIPMCGVPLAVVDNYVNRLIELNLSVAIVSQVGPVGKGPVERQLERIITPGVRLLSHAEGVDDQMIAALYFDLREESDHSKLMYDLVFCYPASGKISVFDNLDRETLLIKFSQLAPKELILPKNVGGKAIDRRMTIVRELERRSPELIIRFRNEALHQQEKASRDLSFITGFSILDPNSRLAVRMIIGYLDEVTVSQVIPIQKIEREQEHRTLLIDASTRNNLDLIINQRTGKPEGSLLDYLDRTKTSGGKRLLKRWVLAPSADIVTIQSRLNAVAEFRNEFLRTKQIKKILNQISDLERLATRLELNVLNPRELGAIRDSLLSAKQLKYVVEGYVLQQGNSFLTNFQKNFHLPEALITLLVDSLQAELSMLFNEGNIFQNTYHPKLEYYRSLKNNGQTLIKELESKERLATGINSLKVKHNNLQGYFLEVTKANLDKVPEHFFRKQSTVNSERFYTAELKRLEEDLVSAEINLVNLEKELFQELRAQVLPFSQEIRTLYHLISELDVLVGFACLSEEDDLICPSVNSELNIKIVNGRHPVLGKILKSDFVSNDLFLNSELANCLIITGPNMGGKSTYLRQVALSVIMAQLGSFIPASEAEIGLVDRIFARIGASDDLMEGDSTFMLEMKEASEIIRNSTNRSLVLVDELGRGTSTTDGYAIAQAVLEWLVEQTKARTLFATHFHQLTQLSHQYQQIKNFSVASIDIEGQVLFTHEIIAGPANNSYGLEVAKLAGLPEPLLERAAIIIDSSSSLNSTPKLNTQISFFSEPVKRDSIDLKKVFPAKERLEKLEQELKAIDPNNLTPRQALEVLYQITTKLHD